MASTTSQFNKPKHADQRRFSRVCMAIALCTVFSPSLVTSLNAQDLNNRKQNNQDQLKETQRNLDLGEIRKQELEVEISALGKDRARINRQLIESAAKARQLEQAVSRTGLRLEELEDQSKTLKNSLNQRKGVLIEVLAALQRIGKKPPPALLVKPEDALSSVRSAILLSAVVPEMRAETEILLAEIKDLSRISSEITTKREVLSTDLAALSDEEKKLTVLLSKKQKLTASARTALATESTKVAELAAKATSLSRLIASLDNEITSTRKAADAARLAEEKRNVDEAARIKNGRKLAIDPAFQDAARIAPAIKFVAAKGKLPKPVNGVEITSYGRKDSFGQISNGLSIATKEGERVVSPADGWVIYSGPFRTYGQLLILNAGDGYRIVLAGMQNTGVQLGQFVLTGEPIGVMGSKETNGNIISETSTQPVLYVEFRNRENPVDPSPWWSNPSLKVATDDS